MASGICTLAVLVIGGVLAISRQNESRCLNVMSNAMYIFDVQTGYYAIDRRYADPGPQITRGATSPDGTRRAYFTANEHVVSLYVEPAEPDDHNPPVCANLQECWRSRHLQSGQGAPTFRFGVGANQSAWLAWSRTGDAVALGWIDLDGWLRVAVASPTGKILNSRKIDQMRFGRASLGHVFPYGWLPDGEYIAFATIGRPRNRIYFWSPPNNQIIVRNLADNDAYFASTWSPRGDRFAYITERDRWPYLVIVSPADGTETAYALGSRTDWMLRWSPDGRRIAVQWSEDTDWRIDIFEPGRGAIRNVGGRLPGNIPGLRSSRPEIAWSADGNSLAFVRERAPGKAALTAFRLQTGRYDDIVSDVVSEPFVGPLGQIFVRARQTGGRLQLIVVEPDGTNLRVIARDADSLPYVRWLGADRANLLLYHAVHNGVLRVVLVDVRSGKQMILADKLDSAEHQTLTASDRGPIEFAWIKRGIGAGISVFSREGDLIALYQVSHRAFALQPSPDGRLAAVSINLMQRYWGLQLASADGKWVSPVLLDSMDSPSELSSVKWSADSRYLAYIRHDTRRLYGTNPRLEVLNTQGERVQVFDQVSEYYDTVRWTNCD